MRPLAPFCHGGVEEDRDRGQDQRRGDEVVLCGTGLADDQGVALEDDRGGGDAERPTVVRPPDAPGGEERDRQPAEVEEQRERVALGEKDPDPVQQLRVLRVEPVGEDRLGVGVAGDRVALGEIGRVGHVVPEGVEVEDAAVQRVLCCQAPVGEYDCDHAHRDQGHEEVWAAGSATRGRGVPIGPVTVGAGPGVNPGCQQQGCEDQRPAVEDLGCSEELGEEDQEGYGEDRLDEVGRGALPLGEEATADPDRAEPDRDDDGREQGHGEDVGAGADHGRVAPAAGRLRASGRGRRAAARLRRAGPGRGPAGRSRPGRLRTGRGGAGACFRPASCGTRLWRPWSRCRS